MGGNSSKVREQDRNEGVVLAPTNGRGAAHQQEPAQVFSKNTGPREKAQQGRSVVTAEDIAADLEHAKIAAEMRKFSSQSVAATGSDNQYAVVPVLGPGGDLELDYADLTLHGDGKQSQPDYVDPSRMQPQVYDDTKAAKQARRRSTVEEQNKRLAEQGGLAQVLHPNDPTYADGEFGDLAGVDPTYAANPYAVLPKDAAKALREKQRRSTQKGQPAVVAMNPEFGFDPDQVQSSQGDDNSGYVEVDADAEDDSVLNQRTDSFSGFGSDEVVVNPGLAAVYDISGNGQGGDATATPVAVLNSGSEAVYHLGSDNAPAVVAPAQAQDPNVLYDKRTLPGTKKVLEATDTDPNKFKPQDEEDDDGCAYGAWCFLVRAYYDGENRGKWRLGTAATIAAVVGIVVATQGGGSPSPAATVLPATPPTPPVALGLQQQSSSTVVAAQSTTQSPMVAVPPAPTPAPVVQNSNQPTAQGRAPTHAPVAQSNQPTAAQPGGGTTNSPVGQPPAPTPQNVVTTTQPVPETTPVRIVNTTMSLFNSTVSRISTTMQQLTSTLTSTTARPPSSVAPSSTAPAPQPTVQPTVASNSPTAASHSPTAASNAPTVASAAPTLPTLFPTVAPVASTGAPVAAPTRCNNPRHGCR